MSVKTLSKSRFKLTLECPTKVAYSLDRERYVNTEGEDELLEALQTGYRPLVHLGVLLP